MEAPTFEGQNSEVSLLKLEIKIKPLCVCPIDKKMRNLPGHLASLEKSKAATCNLSKVRLYTYAFGHLSGSLD